MKARVFILKITKFRESDLIVHVLNGEGAKLSLIARGALRSKKRFGGGVLEPTHLVEAVYEEPKNESEVGVLVEAQLVYAFEKIRSDYERLNQGIEFLKLIEKVSRHGSHDSKHLYDLLGNALRALEVTSKTVILDALFNTKLLAYQGVLLQFEGAREMLECPIKDHEKLNLTPADQFKIKELLKLQVRDYLYS